MNTNAIKEVVGIITEARHPNDRVCISIGGYLAEENCLCLTNAPSYVLDAITDSGYYLSAKYGTVMVSAQDDEED